MKCKLCVMFMLCIFMAVITAGCGLQKNKVVDSNVNLEENIVDITQWPQNRFTDVIVEPTSGTADYVIDNSGNGKYVIFYSDISMEESEQYIEELKNIGYQSVTDKKEVVAIGVVLEKDNVILSISACEGGLGIYISIE